MAPGSWTWARPIALVRLPENYIYCSIIVLLYRRMALNLHHLRLFRAVAADGTLTGAARQLNLSQSAVSTQIKALEASLGHDLFERRGRGLVLTEAGRIALDHAEAIFRTADDLTATLRETSRCAPRAAGRRTRHAVAQLPDGVPAPPDGPGGCRGGAALRQPGRTAARAWIRWRLTWC